MAWNSRPRSRGTAAHDAWNTHARERLAVQNAVRWQTDLAAERRFPNHRRRPAKLPPDVRHDHAQPEASPVRRAGHGRTASFGPPQAKLRRDRPVVLASLAGKPLILPSRPHGIRTLVDHACAVSRVELTIAAETNALSVQKTLALGGHGLTILPSIAVADDLARGSASAAPLRNPKITRTIVLALAANRTVSRPVRCTLDVLVQCIKDTMERGTWFDARWLGNGK